MDDEVAITQLVPIFGVDERASPGADDLVLGSHDVADGLPFDGPKTRLAILAKDVGNGAAGHLFDASVAVDKCEAQSAGDVASERRLAAAAEADQDQVV